MTTQFSEAVIDKAHGYYERRKRTMRDLGRGVYSVKGSAAKPYIVRTDADPDRRKMSWATCTCPHGKNAGGGLAHCSHVVAVLLAIRNGDTLLEGEFTP
jgi:hypothetical protein